MRPSAVGCLEQLADATGPGLELVFFSIRTLRAWRLERVHMTIHGGTLEIEAVTPLVTP